MVINFKVRKTDKNFNSEFQGYTYTEIERLINRYNVINETKYLNWYEFKKTGRGLKSLVNGLGYVKNAIVPTSTNLSYTNGKLNNTNKIYPDINYK